jgi:hypothetical protein
MPLKIGELTGASSQVSPNSSIFVRRSSTRGLMNSAICRILAGRLVTIRATTLKYNGLRLRRTQTDIYINARLERFWEHGENRGYLHEIYSDVQNKRLIVMISAFQASALVHRLNLGIFAHIEGPPQILDLMCDRVFVVRWAG